MATGTQLSDGSGFLERLRSVAAAASERAADTDLGKKLAPVVEQGRKATSTGLKAAGHMGEQTLEIATQKRLWDEQRALVDQVLEVLTLQQALIEDLRSRLAVLEGDDERAS
ncbi:hypothetical protein [Geodermatophilus sp. URMC 62]|uniref:hypothetical protein n=1 Tax=Geodermatophilus sp. URMC 62 TaxID=3423414 RepID=UPI00406CFB7B